MPTANRQPPTANRQPPADYGTGLCASLQLAGSVLSGDQPGRTHKRHHESPVAACSGRQSGNSCLAHNLLTASHVLQGRRPEVIDCQYMFRSEACQWRCIAVRDHIPLERAAELRERKKHVYSWSIQTAECNSVFGAAVSFVFVYQQEAT